MASPVSNSIIVTTLFLSSLSLFQFSFATSNDNNNDRHLSFASTAYFPKRQAEKLIMDLNLFPDDDVNVAAHEFLFESIAEKKIIERRFELPVIGNSGPSVQELGHHAGYYRLPHSQSAR